MRSCPNEEFKDFTIYFFKITILQNSYIGIDSKLNKNKDDCFTSFITL